MIRARRTATALAVAALLGAACSNDDPPSAAGQDAGDGDVPADDGGDDSASTDGDGEDGSATTEDDDGQDGDDGGDGGDGGESTTLELDETQDHPNGTSITLTAIELDPNGIYVSFEAHNGHTQEVTLAMHGGTEGASSDFTQLFDDTGRNYDYQGPSDNPSLVLEPNADMSARLGFLGRVPDDATTVTLQLNYNRIQDRRLDDAHGDRTLWPTFIFEDLPLPGR